jgi:hypothetical protein
MIQLGVKAQVSLHDDSEIPKPLDRVRMVRWDHVQHADRVYGTVCWKQSNRLAFRTLILKNDCCSSTRSEPMSTTHTQVPSCLSTTPSPWPGRTSPGRRPRSLRSDGPKASLAWRGCCTCTAATGARTHVLIVALEIAWVSDEWKIAPDHGG